MNTQVGRHLYQRGWFGLIPILGFFLGLWLVTLGVFRYRDGKLILIGLGGMLFTILIYGGLAYYTFHTEAGRSKFIEVAKMSMNSLIKDIEFYKLQNGKYPDSLEQIDYLSRGSFIYDPISTTTSTKFYYQNLDSGYTLFSCGLDRIAKTKDDVYPDLNSDKTGLIKLSY